MLRIAFAFIVAVLVASAAAAVIQTQFNLAALADLAVPIDGATRWAATQHDLLHFTPTMAMMMAATLAVALPIAYAFYRRRMQRNWFPVAGFVGLMAAFQLIHYLAPMPNLLAVNREILGWLMMCLCGGLAGQLFVTLGLPAAQDQNPC